MAIRSLEALEKACENKNIYDVILEDDCMERGVTREESEKKMADLYAAIQHSLPQLPDEALPQRLPGSD